MGISLIVGFTVDEVRVKVDKPLSICVVGGEDVRMRIPLLKKLQKRGHRCCAIGSEDGSRFARAGIPYERYDLNRGLNPIADLKSIIQLHRILADLKPDVAHAFDTKPALLLPIAARLAKVKGVVRTITGMGYLFSSNEVKALTLRLVYHALHKVVSNLSDATIFQNIDDQIYFTEKKLCPMERTHLVRGSGLDVDAFMNPRIEEAQLESIRDELDLHNVITFIMVARLVKNKGVEEYLLSARQIKAKHSNVRFLLVGPRETEGSQAVPQSMLLDYADVVSWLGQRSDVRELLAVSDAFVLPSYYREGLPRVLLEAGAFGLPLVTTDMPGCREVVENGWNGFLVKPRSVSSLVMALEKILLAEDLGKSMGQINIKHIRENFDLSLVANAYEDIYREVVCLNYL